ncbi:hypothetical protein CDD83_4685 [Cordyceps sp. RAO-2017]|nr:hypothetical protein CDD83_4685 [Cordyceps sp. RAO-2017]
MATPQRVPVTLPDDKVPTKAMVRDIVGAFLRREWPGVDAETLSMSYRASFANAHCPVQRPAPAPGNPAVEPLKVFIKFHRPAAADFKAFEHLAPSRGEEALLCRAFGRTGLGARVYGFFQTADGTLGRVDEFLEARCLEPADVEEARVRADVARALATFHAMRAPLEDKKAPQAYHEAVTAALERYRGKDRLKALGREAGVSVDALVDYDFGTRLAKAVERLTSMGAKTGWCIHDVQFMNVLVRERPREGESTVALVDFEFVMRNYRGLDIGGHFMQKLFTWFGDRSRIASCRPYSEPEKLDFCAAYAARWNGLTGDADTPDRVLREAECGYLLAVAFDIHNMLCFMSEQGEGDPLDLEGLNKLFDEFVHQYARLGFEDA